MLETVVIVVHLLMALALVGLVLLQQGKGAEAGASFGAGASGTVFGSQGSATFLSRFTGMLAAVFFATSLGLAYFASQKAEQVGQIGLPDPAVLESPKKIVDEDVPVLNERAAPAELEDVPEVPGQ